MKVLLVKDVKSLGKSGEVKEVKDGYGKNFLIARGFGLLATNDVLRKYKSQLKKQKQQEDENIQEAKDLAEKLNSSKLTIKHKVGANGHLIGSVTNKEIALALENELKIIIDKKNIVLEDKIKAPGIFEITCKLGHGVNALIKVDVMGES